MKIDESDGGIEVAIAIAIAIAIVNSVMVMASKVDGEYRG